MLTETGNRIQYMYRQLRLMLRQNEELYTVQNTVPAAVNANKALSAKITPCHSWLPVGGPSVLRGGGE
jgi:hypothetical protein